MQKQFLFSLLLLCSFNSFAQIDTAGLIGWYPFNNNANDSSIHGYNGLINGATSVSDRFGNVNSAYSFDGSTNYIEITYPIHLDTLYTGFTISSWCKFNTLPGRQPENILLLIDSMYEKTFALWLDNSVQKLGACNGITGIACHNYISSIDTQTANVWYNIVMTSDFTKNLTSLYINGVLQGTSTDAVIKPNIKYLRIGQYTGDWYMDGLIDDIGIWGKALDSCSVAKLYSDTACKPDISLKIPTITNTEISVYPNPIENALFIKSSVVIEKIEITNLLGQVVLTDLLKNEINLSKLSRGMYILRINNTFITKIIKN